MHRKLNINTCCIDAEVYMRRGDFGWFQRDKKPGAFRGLRGNSSKVWGVQGSAGSQIVMNFITIKCASRYNNAATIPDEAW